MGDKICIGIIEQKNWINWNKHNWNLKITKWNIIFFNAALKNVTIPLQLQWSQNQIPSKLEFFSKDRKILLILNILYNKRGNTYKYPLAKVKNTNSEDWAKLVVTKKTSEIQVILNKSV